MPELYTGTEVIILIFFGFCFGLLIGTVFGIAIFESFQRVMKVKMKGGD